MKKQLLLLVMMVLPMIALADKSGTCGDNVTWTFVESTGTLTIKGSGAMQDYTNNNHAPWHSYSIRTNIKTIIIEDGITHIGNYAFISCYLTSVKISNSVTSIGDRAFSSCLNLNNITIPNGVTSIGEYVFYKCI